ncbi:MAG: membrane dipeptidase [Actinobacteria bacterium]|nr:membrane dipeptidase [Actinomycetota bacterium]
MTIPVFDGHNDVVLRLDEGRSFLEESSEGHLDLPRARRGGFAGGIFAIFVSGPEHGDMEGKPDGPYSFPLAASIAPEFASSRADRLEEILRGLDDQGALRLVKTAAEIEDCFETGTIAAVLHLEGAEPILNPEDMERRYDRGLRSLGLVWSRANKYAEGVPFRFPASPDTGPGLSQEGRHLVRTCNRLGVLVDLSHLNLRGFFDVVEISDAPLVASHSNAHALCASTRNLTDEQLDMIAATNGLVGVNFAVGFLRADGQLNPEGTPLETVVGHIDYLVERMGIDCVGLGSDFEGAAPPTELGDASLLPALFDALRDRGYDDDALAKIAHGNWIRVLRETWGS